MLMCQWKGPWTASLQKPALQFCAGTCEVPCAYGKIIGKRVTVGQWKRVTSGEMGGFCGYVPHLYNFFNAYLAFS